ncbi:MAG: DUF1801 domain-containing protein [Candidatus Dormibacteraeota bacterium]|nr:DUF1801 domain-containing protein [Candidatus Dormibacteraeota bacterium]
MSLKPSELIDKQIADLKDWRGPLMTELRSVIRKSDPRLTEEWKWDTAVWTHNGNVCALGVFKNGVKINFFKGASLPDPKHLFNAGLEAKVSRAIDIAEGGSIDKSALRDLVRAAVASNSARR